MHREQVVELADITIDDMLRWESGELRLLAPDNPGPDILDRPVTWAVAIRATMPALPTIRGGEIVIVPGKLLTELEAAELVGWDDIMRLLATHPAASVVVDDPGLTSGTDLPVLLGSSEFVADAESRLNRELTERRAHLYRFGSDLARALSSAAMAGAGADALLSAAERVAGRSLVLAASDGRLLARSSSAATSAAEVSKQPISVADGGMVRIADGSREWLIQRLVRNDLPEDTVLAVELQRDEPVELARQVLSETAESLAVLLERGASREVDPVRERERIVADILLGRRWSIDSLDGQGMLRELDPSSGLRVGLVSTSQEHVRQRVRSTLYRDRRWLGAALSGAEYGLILDEPLDDNDWRDLRSLCRLDDSLIVSVSSPVHSVERLQSAVHESRRLLRLAGAGLIAGPFVNADDLEQLGVYGVLHPMWQASGATGNGGPERQRAIADRLLEPLDRHDRQRNGELVSSLAAYLRAGGSLTAAASALGVHRNTLSYRLARINDLLDRDLGDADTRFLFQLALTIRRMSDVLDKPKD